MLHEYKPWKLRDGLPTSSRNLVISAGMGTTGTHGVMTALENLGMHGYHWQNSRASANEHANKSKLPDFVVPLLDKLGSNVSFNECYKTVESFDFSQLPSNVDYVSDSPFTEMFLDLYMQFPGAKVVLTTRHQAQP
ncbi:unnamed protein product [Effrenium voratum]|uniref:Uncharacterized protein n=1 Tax=Effrenium voratum TaxID=2562239 RepID=A0AA36N8U3_9DINO|nr:unnamed protein product [Effrenium voratum]CAJ1430674.1 unnamed protein product [Effrenium voratum]